MYVSLSKIGRSTNAYTDNTIYPCASLAMSNQFFPYYDDQKYYKQNNYNPLQKPLNDTITTSKQNSDSKLTTSDSSAPVLNNINPQILQKQNPNSLFIPLAGNQIGDFKQELYTSPYSFISNPNTSTIPVIPQYSDKSSKTINDYKPIYNKLNDNSKSLKTINDYKSIYTKMNDNSSSNITMNDNKSIYTKMNDNSSSNITMNDNKSIYTKMNDNNSSNITINYNPQSEIKDKKLLPVLESNFNLREICKQSILLEDHLSQKDKRCLDCIVKHFLALEGLSEEAITLDKNGLYKKELENLPNEIREIQKFWFSNPEMNSHQTAQKLREIRKRFQTNVFNFIFENNCKNNQCSI
jgi:hypothetical protein